MPGMWLRQSLWRCMCHNRMRLTRPNMAQPLLPMFAMVPVALTIIKELWFVPIPAAPLLSGHAAAFATSRLPGARPGVTIGRAGAVIDASVHVGWFARESFNVRPKPQCRPLGSCCCEWRGRLMLCFPLWIVSGRWWCDFDTVVLLIRQDPVHSGS